MEIDSLLQLRLSLQAVMLGWTAGLLYDLLRAWRQRCRRAFFASALDVIYALMVPFLLFFFALRAAGGELRIYQLLCFLGGLILFFTLCSEMLRPLWDFWTEMLLRFFALCLLPFRFLHRLSRKFALFGKKLFHFQKKYYIIYQTRKRFPQYGKWRGTHGKRK